MNENCKFMSANGKECSALKQLYCKKHPDKKCAFHRWKAEIEPEEKPQKSYVSFKKYPYPTNLILDLELNGDITENMIKPAIQKFTERERRVLDFRYRSCYEQEKIAKHMGMSQTTVAKILHRCLHAIRDEIKNTQKTR